MAPIEIFAAIVGCAIIALLGVMVWIMGTRL